MPRLLRSRVAAAIALSCIAAVRLSAQQPGRTEERRTLRVNGEDRAYLLYVPTSWRRGRPAPRLRDRDLQRRDVLLPPRLRSARCVRRRRPGGGRDAGRARPGLRPPG